MGRTIYIDNEWAVEKCSINDIVRIADDIRDEDLEELRAASDRDVLDALISCMEDSFFSLSVKKNGIPLMIFGVAPYTLLCDETCCWAVATQKLKFSGSKFLRCSREVVAAVNRIYPVMSNYVGDWNHNALRWLRWCGFTVAPARRIGIHGEMMHRVERRDQ